MSFIRHFFEINHDIFYFAYGLVFFVLGLSIALQSRSYSRLDLARSLKWLAAFGFLHGFYEWGDLFIPLQSEYLSESTIYLLTHLHLVLLAGSFACLFEFGVALLDPGKSFRWLRLVPSILMAVWVFIFLFPLKRAVPDAHMWHIVANVLARYMIGFPAGMVAAYGLRVHTRNKIQPLQVPHIFRMLQFAGILMVCYAILGGLLVPEAPLFPANILNQELVDEFLGVPVFAFRSMIGLGMVIAIIRALEIFNVETDRLIEMMETENILLAERARIARDLHDGAIQKVYTAGLLVESANKLASGSNLTLTERLTRAEMVLNDAIQDLRRNLGELHEPPSDDALIEGMRKVIDDPRFRSLIDVRLELDHGIDPQITTFRRDHILAILNEALSNVIRHSRAKKVVVRIEEGNGNLILSVSDDGIGLPQAYTPGFGLRNIRDRARILGGDVEVTSTHGRGTIILVSLPVLEKQ